jgi:hypothetical protein
MVILLQSFSDTPFYLWEKIMTNEKRLQLVISLIVVVVIVGVVAAAVINNAVSPNIPRRARLTDYRWEINGLGFPAVVKETAEKNSQRYDLVEVWAKGKPKLGFRGPERTVHFVMEGESPDFARLAGANLCTTFELTPDEEHRNKFKPEIQPNSIGTPQGVKSPFEGYRTVKWSQ